MKLKIQTGHRLSNNVQAVFGDSVTFVNKHGDAMFEVIAQRDGKSIEVRSGELSKVDGVLYSNTLLIKPNVSNSIRVSVEPYNT